LEKSSQIVDSITSPVSLFHGSIAYSKLMTPKRSSVIMAAPFTLAKPLVYSPRVLSSLSLLSSASMPKSPLNLPPSPPACKDILSTLYLGGVPSVAERIISLLNPADLRSSHQVCITWNHLVSSSTQFMGKVNTYRRQCKENAEDLHKTEESMETTVSPVKRIPLAAFTPNTQSQFHTTTASPTPFTGKCIKPWHEGESSGRVNPSKRPRQSEAICGTNKSKKRLRRL